MEHTLKLSRRVRIEAATLRSHRVYIGGMKQSDLKRAAGVLLCVAALSGIGHAQTRAQIEASCHADMKGAMAAYGEISDADLSHKTFDWLVSRMGAAHVCTDNAMSGHLDAAKEYFLIDGILTNELELRERTFIKAHKLWDEFTKAENAKH